MSDSDGHDHARAVQAAAARSATSAWYCRPREGGRKRWSKGERRGGGAERGGRGSGEGEIVHLHVCVRALAPRGGRVDVPFMRAIEVGGGWGALGPVDPSP